MVVSEWKPAQHCYLHCPNVSPGGHPFTCASIPHPLTQTDNKRPFESTQEFIIRVRNGLTRHLYDTATSSRDTESTIVDGHLEGVPIRAWTEGPYGHTTYWGEDYNTLCFVAGGSGISYALSCSLDLVRRARAMRRGSTDASTSIATQRLHLVWTIKKPEQAEWIGKPLREMLEEAPPGFLWVSIYVTGKPREGEAGRFSF